MLTVTIDNVSESVVLRCHGRIVRGEESALLCAAVKHHGSDVVLDLAQVSAIDAAGIGALVSLQAAGIYLKLMNPSEPVRRILQLTGLENLFEIRERSTEDAARDLHQQSGISVRAKSRPLARTDSPSDLASA